MADDKPTPQRNEKGMFLQGVSGNLAGRPKGARSKLGEAFIEDMLAEWETNGPAAIRVVRETKPDAYLKVVAMILPKDLNVNINATEHLTDEQLIERVRSLDAAIRPFLALEGTGGVDGGIGPSKPH